MPFLQGQVCPEGRRIEIATAQKQCSDKTAQADTPATRVGLQNWFHHNLNLLLHSTMVMHAATAFWRMHSEQLLLQLLQSTTCSCSTCLLAPPLAQGGPLQLHVPPSNQL
jgi:hypothetical protein